MLVTGAAHTARSYLLDGPNGTLRRNRRHLQHVPDYASPPLAHDIVDDDDTPSAPLFSADSPSAPPNPAPPKLPSPAVSADPDPPDPNAVDPGSPKSILRTRRRRVVKPVVRFDL